jgi:hypothetical protein
LQGCLAAGKPVLLVGGSGVAKSAIVKVGQFDQISMAQTEQHRVYASKACCPAFRSQFL